MPEMMDEQPLEDRLDLRTVALFRRRLWPYIRRYRLAFAGSTALILLSTACALTTPWFLGYTVDHVLIPHQAGLLLSFALVFLGIDLVRAAAMIGQNLVLTWLGQRVLHDLRQDLLRQYQFYPVSEFNRTPTGRLVTRLVNDTSSLQDLFTGGLAVALGESVIVVGIIVWLVVLHPALGLVCVSVFPLMCLAAKLFAGRIRDAFRSSRAALSRLNAFLAENIAGMATIQLFNKQPDFRRRFNETSSRYTAALAGTVRSFAHFTPTITILGSLSMSLLLWYGGYRALSETVTLGLLVTFMSYLQALYAPIRDITEKYNLFVSAMTACERIFEFMDRPRENGTDSLAPVAPHAPFASGCSVEFRDVWFRYPGSSGPWVLRNLAFTASPGEQIGIVGHTGAGKTTLSTLLMRFHDLDRGAILIDGHDIRALDRRTVRQSIGYIQQDAFLFSGTVEDNILLWENGRRRAFDALPDSARACFESGQLHPGKEVFEKAANLSTGERQIISLLRALTQNPPILILDEATAHVDSLTEQWVAKLTTEAFRNRTALIIAHRLATLRSVDRILVLHHGELVESGTHRQLLAAKGVYRKLYEIQSRREELEGELASGASPTDGGTAPCPPQR